MAMIPRLTPHDERALVLRAAADGISTQEAAARAIHEAASGRLQPVTLHTLSVTARERYADLLDRLGK